MYSKEEKPSSARSGWLCCDREKDGLDKHETREMSGNKEQRVDIFESVNLEAKKPTKWF